MPGWSEMTSARTPNRRVGASGSVDPHTTANRRTGNGRLRTFNRLWANTLRFHWIGPQVQKQMQTLLWLLWHHLHNYQPGHLQGHKTAELVQPTVWFLIQMHIKGQVMEGCAHLTGYGLIHFVFIELDPRCKNRCKRYCGYCDTTSTTTSYDICKDIKPQNWCNRQCGSSSKCTSKEK